MFYARTWCILNKKWEWDHIKVAYMALFAFIVPMIIGQILALIRLQYVPDGAVLIALMPI